MGRHASAAPAAAPRTRRPELLVWGIVVAVAAAVAGVLVHLPWLVVLVGAVVVLVCFALPWLLSGSGPQDPRDR